MDSNASKGRWDIILVGGIWGSNSRRYWTRSTVILSKTDPLGQNQPETLPLVPIPFWSETLIVKYGCWKEGFGLVIGLEKWPILPLVPLHSPSPPQKFAFKALPHWRLTDGKEKDPLWGERFRFSGIGRDTFLFKRSDKVMPKLSAKYVFNFGVGGTAF